MKADDVDATDSGPPVRTLLSLVVALVLSVGLLRGLTAGSGDGSAPDTLAGQPPDATAPFAAPPSPALVRPVPTPERLLFANTIEASRWLGMPFRSPRWLPPNLVLWATDWQMDSFVLVPGQPPPGMLQTWYWSLEQGTALLLEQGPGVRVTANRAPPGASGTVDLHDGTRLVWVRGHPETAGDPRAVGQRWTGDELSLGVDQDAVLGWRLVSGVLTLEELVRVAEGLQ